MDFQFLLFHRVSGVSPSIKNAGWFPYLSLANVFKNIFVMTSTLFIINLVVDLLVS